jgi:protein-L-isoaspartate(D-aspartate) O-methyltransferase
MVQELMSLGITDKNVLAAMAKVERHRFVDEALEAQAYSNNALPLGYGQTISTPSTVALFTSFLTLTRGLKVLELGTGSGYQAAVMVEMGAEVFSIERNKSLYLAALKRLNELRYFTISLRYGDGTLGWPEESPFDRIVVTASSPKVPTPLLGHLADNGILLVPVSQGNGKEQRLLRIRKDNGAFFSKDLGPVNFVRLIGQHAWQTNELVR